MGTEKHGMDENMASRNEGESQKGYKFGRLTGEVTSACREVARELGSGFAELTYQRSLALELTKRGIPFKREAELTIYYKDEAVDVRYADFLVAETLIVELKAVKELTDEHVAQLAMYLKAARFRLGLLVNFGEKYVRIRRVVNFQVPDTFEENDET